MRADAHLPGDPDGPEDVEVSGADLPLFCLTYAGRVEAAELILDRYFDPRDPDADWVARGLRTCFARLRRTHVVVDPPDATGAVRVWVPGDPEAFFVLLRWFAGEWRAGGTHPEGGYPGSVHRALATVGVDHGVWESWIQHTDRSRQNPAASAGSAR